MMKFTFGTLAGVVVILLAGCGGAADDTYTLYGGNGVSANLRVHVATFDATEPLADFGQPRADYNHMNCVRTARLFQAQRLIASNVYWCEKGKYRK